MKKLLLWLFGLVFIGLFGQVFAYQVNLEWRYTAYFNIYKNQFPVELEIKDWKLVYINHLLNKNFVNILEKAGKHILAVKLKADIVWWNYNSYIWEIYNLGNKNDYDVYYLAKSHPYKFNIEKPYITFNWLTLKPWLNNTIICYSTNLNRTDFENWKIPFKYAFCSIPIKIYYYNWKIFLDENKYNEYKKEIDSK